MEIELRPYQKECLEVIDNLEKGNHLVHLATGLGKTVIFSHIKRKGRVLILSHRDELVHQPEKYYDCSFGVEQATERSHGEEVVSASVQSIVRRLNNFNPDDFEIIITDEAHHSIAPSYKKIYDYFNPRLYLGFTATPNRADKQGLDEIYEDIIFSRDLKWGIDNGYLCDINCMEADIKYDISKVKRKNGDLDLNQLANAINTKQSNEFIAKAYEELAVGQTIIFSANVSHAEAISREIKGSVVVSGKTQNRDEIIEAFVNKKIRCLVNCMVFTEGTDIPLIETVMIARPTQNVSLYQQMVGRGLRLSKGKKRLTLIDCVGVTGKLKICTAPSLLGIDKSLVTDNNRLQECLISNMSKVLSNMEDLPKKWKVNATYVNLFAEEQNINTCNINWFLHCDGKMSCSITPTDKITVNPIDQLNNTTATHDKMIGRNKISSSIISSNKPINNVMQDCFNYLCDNFIVERSIWDLNVIKKWGYAPASEKQKKYIYSVLNRKNIDITNFSFDKLTKIEASQIITRLLNE